MFPISNTSYIVFHIFNPEGIALKAFVNGNDIGLYWLIEGSCQSSVPCCCLQGEIRCGQPSQRYYHIPADWLMPKKQSTYSF
ncbi:unnamed protein product [Adineta steineri]|uniref:Beta-galactosidase galactose-binding domain-containing protein n=1 Tax=Adineta steineri TaxID=433720 RepID=A0A813Y2M5_9BILA|nr:unnamed protein product [Adineta steineri]